MGVDDEGYYTLEAGDAVARFTKEHRMEFLGHMLMGQRLSHDRLDQG